MGSVFQIIGPPMVGPSSSHTAGAVRIGLLARSLLGEPPVRTVIGLHGSFAATGRGHGTDRGLVAGLMGWNTDDERIKDALAHAKHAGLEVVFRGVDLGDSVHPNSAQIELAAADGGRLNLVASSIGGGSVEVSRLDGFETRLTGALDTLVVWHLDRTGFLAQLTAVLASVAINIATLRTARTHRGAAALTVVEADAAPCAEAIALLRKMEHTQKVRLVPKLV